jgi:elongation factor Ts
MTISIELVKQLREESGMAVDKCKKALEQAGGDMDAAKVLLQEFAAGQAGKKADRELAAGIVASYVHNNKTVGTIIKLECETDFVAKADDFIAFANGICMHITAMASTAESLDDEVYILDGERTIHQVREALMQKLGERIEITQLHRLVIGE